MSGDTLEARLVEFADWLDDGNCDAAAALVLEARDALAELREALQRYTDRTRVVVTIQKATPTAFNRGDIAGRSFAEDYEFGRLTLAKLDGQS